MDEVRFRVVGVGLSWDYAVTIVAVRYQRVTVAFFKACHGSTGT